MELVDLLQGAGQLINRDAVFQAVWAREQIRSTGIGEGLAVPHAKTQGCLRLTMAVGKPAEPLEFESADRRPCGLVVLLTGPVASAGPHLQALAQISRLWLTPSFRSAAVEARTAEELFNLFESNQS